MKTMTTYMNAVKQKRCKCLLCYGMGEITSIYLQKTGMCQACGGNGWLYKKDFLDQVKGHMYINNLEIIDAYENGPSEEIPVP